MSCSAPLPHSLRLLSAWCGDTMKVNMAASNFHAAWWMRRFNWNSSSAAVSTLSLLLSELPPLLLLFFFSHPYLCFCSWKSRIILIVESLSPMRTTFLHGNRFPLKMKSWRFESVAGRQMEQKGMTDEKKAPNKWKGTTFEQMLSHRRNGLMREEIVWPSKYQILFYTYELMMEWRHRNNCRWALTLKPRESCYRNSWFYIPITCSR